MRYAFNAAGVGEALVRTYKIGATVIQGQVVIWDINGPGHVQDASTTGAADAFGVTLAAGTYSTTQGTGASSADVEVEMVLSPLAVYQARISGNATSGTALLTAGDATYWPQILTNSTASSAGTLISTTAAGTIVVEPATVIGLTGANKGATRISASHVDNTSITVTVPFDYTIAANDKFVMVPLSAGMITAQLTTALDEIDGIIVSGTGIPAGVVDVTFDLSSESAPEAYGWITLRDHFLNPLS